MKRLLLCLFTCCISVLLFAQNDQTPTPQWRPLYHFTPEKYWTNDPNGLIYLTVYITCTTSKTHLKINGDT